MTIRPQDLARLRKKLSGLSEIGQQKSLTLAAKSGALLIMNEAKRNVPVVSGTALRSIHVGGFSSENSDFVGHDVRGDYSDLGSPESRPGFILMKIGTNLRYVRYIEYKPGRGQGFMRRAFDSQKDAAKTQVMKSLKILLGEKAK